MGLTCERGKVSVPDGPQGTYDRGVGHGSQSDPGLDSAWVNRGKSWVLKRSWVKNKTEKNLLVPCFSPAL